MRRLLRSRSSHLYFGQIFEESDHAGVIEPAAALNAKRGEELLDQCSCWNRRSDRPRSILDQVQILCVQVDFETGGKISGQNLFRLLIEALASGKTSCERANHFLRIDTGFRSKYQGLADGGQIDRNDDLVCQLCKSSSAQSTHVGDRFAKRLKNWKRTLEVPWFAARHDGEGRIDSTLLAAAHRRVNHGYAYGSKFRSDFLRNDRIDRTHVDEELSAPGAGLDAIGTKCYQLHIRGIRQHGDHYIRDRGHLFRRCSSSRAFFDEFVHLGPRAVMHDQWKSGFDEVPGHGFPHDAETDKSDSRFHLFAKGN